MTGEPTVKQSVRRILPDPETWREDMLRALLAGAAEGILAACLVLAFFSVAGWLK